MAAEETEATGHAHLAEVDSRGLEKHTRTDESKFLVWLEHRENMDERAPQDLSTVEPLGSVGARVCHHGCKGGKSYATKCLVMIVSLTD